MLAPTPMTVDEMIEVLNAFKNKKAIEYIYVDSPYNNWSQSDFPVWNFAVYRYRVKDEQVDKNYYQVSELPYPFFVRVRAMEMCHTVIRRSDFANIFGYDEKTTFTPYTAAENNLLWSADGKNWKSFVKD